MKRLLLAGCAIAALTPIAEAQTTLSPPVLETGIILNQSKDMSGTVISSATDAQIPESPPYGDQGYTVNAWGNCNCIGNPALDNNDTLRIVGYNNGTGPAQVNGVSIYMVGNAANAKGIGQTTGLHLIEVDQGDGPMWGLDVEQADSPFLTGYGGTNSRYFDNELDFNFGSSQTVGTYLTLGGTILQQPTYLSGISLNPIGTGKASEFLVTGDGKANVVLHAGLLNAPDAPWAGSQPIQMDWTDGTNAKNSLYFTAYANTMVLSTTDKATVGPAYSVQNPNGGGATGIYATVHVSATCSLIISGGLVTQAQGSC